MPFTWQYDATTGTYKSHALSNDVRFAAIEATTFFEHVKAESGFGKRMGESVTIPRISNLIEPTSAQLSETTQIPEDVFAMSVKTITAKELGRKVSWTQWGEMLASFDLPDAIVTKLRQQMTLVLDSISATAAKRAKVRFTPTGVSSYTATSNGTFGATASVNIGVYHLSQIHDLLYDTYKAPYADQDAYIGIFRQLAVRGVMDDPNWEKWHQYTDPQSKYHGEAGMIDRIRIVRTNHANALGKVGTGSVLGEGIVMGADALAMVEVLTPEIRQGIPQDLGRSRLAGWYGGLEVDLVWDTANPGEANILYVGSL